LTRRSPRDFAVAVDRWLARSCWQGRQIEAADRYRGVCRLLCAVVLVLHWAATHRIEADDLAGLNDASVAASVLNRSSLPLSLVRNVPRSVAPELRLATVADQSGLPSSKPVGAPARAIPQRPATSPTPRGEVKLAGPTPSPIRSYRSRAPPGRPVA
jgi:hypothetical protein